jgi:hypothetical protein
MKANNPKKKQIERPEDHQIHCLFGTIEPKQAWKAGDWWENQLNRFEPPKSMPAGTPPTSLDSRGD